MAMCASFGRQLDEDEKADDCQRRDAQTNEMTPVRVMVLIAHEIAPSPKGRKKLPSNSVAEITQPKRNRHVDLTAIRQSICVPVHQFIPAGSRSNPMRAPSPDCSGS
jgi:hypothetical protein